MLFLCVLCVKYFVDYRYVGTSDEILEMFFVVNIDIEDVFVMFIMVMYDL